MLLTTEPTNGHLESSIKGETVRNVMKELDSLRAKQATIDKLLDEGSMEVKKNGIANKWTLEPLYQGEDCSVGFVHINNVELGPCGEHTHPESREYLIVAKGSILLNVNGIDIRVVREGECAAIDYGVKHFSEPLEDGTKLIYVCIPYDLHLPSPLKGGRRE